MPRCTGLAPKVVWAYDPILRERGVAHELARPLARALIFAPSH